MYFFFSEHCLCGFFSFHLLLLLVVLLLLLHLLFNFSHFLMIVYVFGWRRLLNSNNNSNDFFYQNCLQIFNSLSLSFSHSFFRDAHRKWRKSFKWKKCLTNENQCVEIKMFLFLLWLACDRSFAFLFSSPFIKQFQCLFVCIYVCQFIKKKNVEKLAALHFCMFSESGMTVLMHTTDTHHDHHQLCLGKYLHIDCILIWECFAICWSCSCARLHYAFRIDSYDDLSFIFNDAFWMLFI